MINCSYEIQASDIYLVTWKLVQNCFQNNLLCNSLCSKETLEDPASPVKRLEKNIQFNQWITHQARWSGGIMSKSGISGLLASRNTDEWCKVCLITAG